MTKMTVTGMTHDPITEMTVTEVTYDPITETTVMVTVTLTERAITVTLT